MIEWKAFPLRPEPDPNVRFKGTYREEGWKRCNAMAEPDGIRFTPYPRDDYPSWSLPALEAAKCVALQGPEPFERLRVAYRGAALGLREPLQMSDPRRAYASNPMRPVELEL